MTLSLAVDAGAPGTPLTHLWSACAGAGRAPGGLPADWQEQLRLVRDAAGFRFVRVPGLPHAGMFVRGRDVEGGVVLDFPNLDDFFDRMLHAGVRPFLELDFPQGDFADEACPVVRSDAHTAPLPDLEEWSELIRELAEHCIDRYGLDEVRSWYFEVGSEPSRGPFLQGSHSECLHLYGVAVRALKKADQGLRVGGRTTGDRVSGVREFLAFCHGAGLPVDFVSCHSYATDRATDTHEQHAPATTRDLRMLRRAVIESPYPDAEIHLTGSDPGPSPRNLLQAATLAVKTGLESIGLVHSLAPGVSADTVGEPRAGSTAFHGDFGLVTHQGVPKPAFHAYRMLHLLGDELLAQAEGLVVTRRSATGALAALGYHCPPEAARIRPGARNADDRTERVPATGEPRRLRVELVRLRPRSAVTIETLDGAHGNAFAAWHAMGAPETPTREQTTLLRAAGHATRRVIRSVGPDGRFLFDEDIEPWSVVLLHQGREE
ncbi:GH39 family glycosyl hydrolase [Streptomyces phaeochromogenes]|uniref:GH39 family glycosyl hydrolase n=1 Tax=Streptomyces phaeochromogenes TaxID=1923 RepID=UPI002DDA158B|nr:beta-xylosidase [Streptomyces phaeochromogenes]WRZ34668.1 beta-xylosidase [Streptomyces phaeochromogenes]